MRINYLYVLVVLISLLVTGFLSSCDKHKDREELVLTVSSVNKLFTGYENSQPYFVKYEMTDNWQNFDWIGGFEHEEGHEYMLRIWQEKWHDGEIMDAGMYRYGLIEIISDIEKDSDNIPVQRILSKVKSQKSSSGNYYIRINNEWEEIENLEGFEYEPGYSYSIVIEAHYNGSKATPRYSYTYVETLAKIEGDDFY